MRIANPLCVINVQTGIDMLFKFKVKIIVCIFSLTPLCYSENRVFFSEELSSSHLFYHDEKYMQMDEQETRKE